MHSTKISSSTTSTTSTSTTTNIQSYHYPPITTLRRPGRPDYINIPRIDHNNTQQSNDPGIYSAPIYYLKQTNNHQQHIQHSPQPYTATLQYPPRHHIQMSPHHHSQQQHNIHLYSQQQPQQQQMVGRFVEQHTPHTFPLPASPNHYNQYFNFPPSTIQINITNNSHQATTGSQPSTPTHNNQSRSTQIQEQAQQQPQWSNPVLSSLMNKRMNENPGSISMDDDDEDPSASIDALVADVDSQSQDLLDDEQNKTMSQSKTSSTRPSDTISSPPHLYLRSKSHILTTPPNPLASDDHPDNQLNVGNNYQKVYTPIPSAGFELTTNKNLSSSKPTSCFTFDANLLEQTQLNNQHKKSSTVDDNEDNNHDVISKPLSINNDMRTTRVSSNSLIQDDNSNHSSTNSSSQHTSSRIFGQTLKTSEQQGLSSSSPLSNDLKMSSLDHDNNMNSMSTQQNSRHACTHPDCNKTFTNKSALAKHKLTHSQDRKHVCPKCNKGFKRLDHLNGHMLTHEEEKPHKCRVPNCSRTYCDARSLKRHIENAHQDILAAIHEGGHDQYREFLPETAFVKTKDVSVHNEFSMDSMDSNSPRSLTDNEQSIHIRSSTGSKLIPTYTFDEQKCVECHICKKSFKNGAALNGHMRLHGGFIDKPPQPSSNAPKEKTKRSATTTTTSKRKRTSSPSASVSVKTEAQDRSMISRTNNLYSSQTTLSNPPLNLTTVPKSSYDQTASPGHLPLQSTFITIPTTFMSQHPIKDSIPGQPSTKQIRRTIQMPGQPISPAQIHFSNVQIPLDAIANQRIFTNVSSPLQYYDDKFRESSLSNGHNGQVLQSNGILPHNSYGSSSPYRSPPTASPFQIASQPSPPSSISAASIPHGLLHRLLIQNGERIHSAEFSPQRFSPSEERLRCSPSPHYVQMPVLNPIPVSLTTPVAPSHSHQLTSQDLSLLPVQQCNKDQHMKTIIRNSMQPSLTTHSTASSSSSLTIPSQIPTEDLPKQKEISYIDKQEKPIENHSSSSPPTLEIVPDRDSPTKKQMSGFLINTPSSATASSSSSTSSHTHFNYDSISQTKNTEPTPSSFQWPSQLRRQCSLNLAKQTLNPVPSTPYTPPPMLSPFRKGPGLYYRVFSHPGTSVEPSPIATTPLPPSTPAAEDATGPKINIGHEYQAVIPKLRTTFDDDRSDLDGELLFSPLELSGVDEKSLEKFEELNRINPYLFSPRDSPKAYPLELIYMLLHEYNGDLPRTIASLLEGTAKDIKQCRPLHTYHFLDCDKWTKEEIEAFSKALPTSEKNFEVISRAVGTKSVRQCIEFYYMPKTNLSSKKIVSTRTSAVITRRKRFQMNKAKQQQQQQSLDDDMSSSSSFNELRIEDDGSTMNSDGSPLTYYSCDIDDCLQTFTSNRAYRAHRKEHRQAKNNTMTGLTVTKRTRNFD